MCAEIIVVGDKNQLLPIVVGNSFAHAVNKSQISILAQYEYSQGVKMREIKENNLLQYTKIEHGHVMTNYNGCKTS